MVKSFFRIDYNGCFKCLKSCFTKTSRYSQYKPIIIRCNDEKRYEKGIKKTEKRNNPG